MPSLIAPIAPIAKLSIDMVASGRRYDSTGFEIAEPIWLRHMWASLWGCRGLRASAPRYGDVNHVPQVYRAQGSPGEPGKSSVAQGTSGEHPLVFLHGIPTLWMRRNLWMGRYIFGWVTNCLRRGAHESRGAQGIAGGPRGAQGSPGKPIGVQGSPGKALLDGSIRFWMGR